MNKQEIEEFLKTYKIGEKTKCVCNYCGEEFIVYNNCKPNNNHQCLYTSLPTLAKKVIELENKLKEIANKN